MTVLDSLSCWYKGFAFIYVGMRRRKRRKRRRRE
jgi:hypothetical protein